MVVLFGYRIRIRSYTRKQESFVESLIDQEDKQ